MKKIQYILAGAAFIAFPLRAQAQHQAKDSTMNRTVVVEQEYNPDIMDASKVNVLPKVEPPTVSKKEVEYDATLMPVGEIPAATMQAYTGKEIQQKGLPGYARLGYGNYGNLDARANYLFTLPNRDRLNLTFHMNGMDGKLNLPESKEDWKSYYYRTHAGMDYVHSAKKIDLNIAGHFDLSNFNFLEAPTGVKQKFTSGDVHFGIKSTDDDFLLQFKAETNLLFYERQYDFGAQDSKEGIVRTKAEVSGAISEGQSIGIGFAMDNVFYKNNGLEDYTSIGLNPHYRYENEEWKIRIGANVDMALNFGKEIRVSPDVTAQYNFSGSYILYAQAKGGKLQNDFRRIGNFCPYGQVTPQLDATYEQLNAALGFKASPVDGLWLNLYGGYQDLKDELYFSPVSYGYSEVDSYQMLGIVQQNMSNVYAGAEVSYTYKNIFGFTASGVYRNWDASEKDELEKEKALAYKPAFEANFRVDIRPVPSVQINFGYQHISREKMESVKANAVSNLYVGGSYEIFKHISVYARANNLLNKDYQYYWGHPTEGFNFVGGVSFLF